MVTGFPHSLFKLQIIDAVRLTRRKRDVARLIAEGMSTKEIASRLGVSIHTVHFHRARIRDRIGRDNRTADLETQLRRYFVAVRSTWEDPAKDCC